MDPAKWSRNGVLRRRRLPGFGYEKTGPRGHQSLLTGNPRVLANPGAVGGHTVAGAGQAERPADFARSLRPAAAQLDHPAASRHRAWRIVGAGAATGLFRQREPA